MEKSKKIKIGGGIAVLVLAAYLGGAYYYNSHFLKNTTINGMDCSGKTVAQVEKAMEENVSGYHLTISEREDLSDEVVGKDIKLTYLNNDVIKEHKASQNAFAWPVAFFSKSEPVVLETCSYDEKGLDNVIGAFAAVDKKNVTKPVCAYPEYKGEGKYKIVKEVEGNQCDKKKLKEAVVTSILGGSEALDLDEAGVYKEPAFRKDDQEIKDLKASMEKMVNKTLTYDFSDRYVAPNKFADDFKDGKFTIDADTLSKFVTIKKDHVTAAVDKKALDQWLTDLASDTNTIYRARKFVSHSGKQIVVPAGGPYGWQMSVTKEIKEVSKFLKSGESVERKPIYAQEAATGTYGKMNDIPDSYAEVDLSSQTVYIYKNGKQVFSCSCVSGCISKGHGTDTGVCLVQYKKRDTVLGGPGYDYESPVRYWMPFNMGQGFHDADWRNSFGGSIYKTNGSHGCVNLPIYAAAEIYSIIDAGWAVVVHY